MSVMPQPKKNNGGDVTLDELLDSRQLHEYVIRFICGARKILMENDQELTADDADLSYDINRLYCSFGPATRASAFRSAPPKVKEPAAVIELKKAPAQKAPLVAERVTTQSAYAYALVAIKAMQPNKDTFTFAALKEAVADLHLEKGKRRFHPEDLKVSASNGSPRWVDSLGNAVKKLRADDVIAYRKTKTDYFIF